MRVETLRRLFGPACWLLVACGEGAAPSEPASSRPLVSADAWLELPRAEDPFVSDPDAAPACDGPGFVVEQGVVEIDTGRCGWVTLEQPALLAVRAGQALSISVGHYDLTAPEPAQGHVELALESCPTWSKLVAIPSQAAVYEETFASPCSLDPGARVRFHLHNHGQNNWQLLALALPR